MPFIQGGIKSIQLLPKWKQFNKRNMKREYKIQVYNHFGVFIWRKCECCGDEFRREKGFKFCSCDEWKYICSSCIKGKKEVDEYITERNFHH